MQKKHLLHSLQSSNPTKKTIAGFRSMHLHSCKITVYVVFNESTHTSFCCDFLLPYYLGSIGQDPQDASNQKKKKKERKGALFRKTMSSFSNSEIEQDKQTACWQ